MTPKFSAPRGTTDILPDEISFWGEVETKARTVLDIYGYREIRTPFFEETDLFIRSVGQTSDIVMKQMLHLAPQGQSDAEDIKTVKLSLRPEGTASVARAYIENSLDKKESISKLFYIGPMFRGERPQKGRLRQFHQIGVEAIGPGSHSPYLDAEVIGLSLAILNELGLKDFKLKINTLGTEKDKENFSGELRGLLQPHISRLCPDCQSRFERNVFRVLDCKNKACRDVIAHLNIGYNHLSSDSRDYFLKVKEALGTLGISFIEDPLMVRGLDYYTHTVFEISAASLGSQDALGAGGRYDNLIGQLGGTQGVDAVGFALGIERVLLAGKDGRVPSVKPLDFYVIPLDDGSLSKCFRLLDDLRKSGIASDMGYRLGSMKSQMRSANKAGARFVAIIGEEEEKKGVVAVKDMGTGSQQEVALSEFNRSLFEKLLRQ